MVRRTVLSGIVVSALLSVVVQRLAIADRPEVEALKVDVAPAAAVKSQRTAPSEVDLDGNAENQDLLVKEVTLRDPVVGDCVDVGFCPAIVERICSEETPCEEKFKNKKYQLRYLDDNSTYHIDEIQDDQFKDKEACEEAAVKECLATKEHDKIKTEERAKEQASGSSEASAEATTHQKEATQEQVPAQAGVNANAPLLVRCNQINFQLARVESNVVALEEHLFPDGKSAEWKGEDGDCLAPGATAKEQDAAKAPVKQPEVEPVKDEAAHPNNDQHAADQHPAEQVEDEDLMNKNGQCHFEHSLTEEERRECICAYKNMADHGEEMCKKAATKDSKKCCEWKPRGIVTLAQIAEESLATVGMHTDSNRQHIVATTSTGLTDLTTQVANMEVELEELQKRIFCVENAYDGRKTKTPVGTDAEGLNARALNLGEASKQLSDRANVMTKLIVGE